MELVGRRMALYESIFTVMKVVICLTIPMVCFYGSKEGLLLIFYSIKLPYDIDLNNLQPRLGFSSQEDFGIAFFSALVFLSIVIYGIFFTTVFDHVKLFQSFRIVQIDQFEESEDDKELEQPVLELEPEVSESFLDMDDEMDMDEDNVAHDGLIRGGPFEENC